MADLMAKTVKTPAGTAPVIPVLLIALGGYLTWFGVHYWRSDTRWPTDPLKAVLTGKEIPVADTSGSRAAIKGVVEGAKAGGAGGGGGAPAPGPGGVATGGTLTKEQIKTLWTKNGGSPKTANVAAAVAMAESSGRTGVTSSNPDGGTNVGLWQLDTKGVGSGYTVEQLKNPDTNARITVMATANGTKWIYWEAFTKGRYREFL